MSEPGREQQSSDRAGRNPAVDGLRGFALLGMLAWHAQVSWIRGGFARMTIFFVLSGFLATSSYLRTRRGGADGSFRRFWVRRARRLLPTTLLGIALAIVVTGAVGTIEARRDLVGDVVATLANVVNWRFIAQGRPYGALFERPSSLQHFWSLAVEEQCFWLLPPVLALCGFGIDRLSGAPRARRRVRQRRLVLGAAAALACIPVVWDLDPDAVYYGTHVRGAEFLVGVWLALWLAPGADGKPASNRVRVVRLTGPVGLAVLAVVMLTLDRDLSWLYRGGLSLFAIPAAAAVGGAAYAAPGLRQVLSVPIFRLPGRWALSVYALHWPLFQLVDAWLPEATPAALVVTKFTLALVVGAAVHRWFERPLSLATAPRRTTADVAAPAAAGLVAWGRDRVALPAMASVAVALALLAATVHRPPLDIDFASALASLEPRQAVADQTASSPPPSTVVESPVVPERVGVFGSSSGLLLGFTMSGWLRTHPGWVDAAGDTQLGCGFVLDGRRVEPRNDRPEGVLLRPAEVCDWRTRWPAAASAGRVSLALVVPGRWDITDWVLDGTDTAVDLDDPGFSSFIESQVAGALDALRSAGVQRVALATVPRTGPGRSGRIPEEREFPGDDPGRIARFNDLLRRVAAERPWIRMVEFATWADALSPERHAELFPDGVHTNEQQGPTVWAEYLGPAIDALSWPP